jgi:predicted alpha/beta hydrolase family esterase
MPYLIIPGWAGSGPEHWQTHWERELEDARRVEMHDWLEPRRSDWVQALDHAIRDAAAPPILIAHSLGCVAVAHWAATGGRPVRGALLVAPADLDRASCPPALLGFAPVPRARLPFAAHVVASDDDPHAALDRARQMAADWGASLTVLSGAGHVNADAGFGRWREGRELLRAFGAPRPQRYPVSESA